MSDDQQFCEVYTFIKTYDRSGGCEEKIVKVIAETSEKAYKLHKKVKEGMK